jgi:hypothetical protein
MLRNGLAIHTEGFRQRVDRFTGPVPLDQPVDVSGTQSSLALAHRSGRPSGHPVTTLTSENSTKFGHDVLVGVTAHQLHHVMSRDIEDSLEVTCLVTVTTAGTVLLEIESVSNTGVLAATTQRSFAGATGSTAVKVA